MLLHNLNPHSSLLTPHSSAAAPTHEIDQMDDASEKQDKKNIIKKILNIWDGTVSNVEVILL